MRSVLDNNGDLARVQSKKNANHAYWNYANHFTYNAAGAVTSMQLGNGTWESTTFNSRLQPTQIALGKTQGATNLLDLDYTYGTTVNNGNVMSQTITVPTVGTNTGFTAVQTYSYDPLNRLQQAYERPYGWTDTNCTSDPTKCWKQTFTFDRYGTTPSAEAAATPPKTGGELFDEANTAFEGFDKLCNSNTELCADLRKKLNPAINTSDNRLSSGQGYSFDDAGNTTRDASDRKFTYDAENKQVKVESLSPGTNTITGTVGEYFYDGDGKRVKKHVPSTGEVTIFVYDAAGKLIEEYSTIIASTNDAKVAYLTNDHLGSPRINTDANGAMTSRHDYHPFGEEIATSQRIEGLGFVGDTIRKQFTGYEGDEETGLEFAQARYYSGMTGRFGSADPIVITKNRLVNPQGLNLFVYVRNNPLKFVDKTGLDLILANQHARTSGALFSGMTKSEQSRIQVAEDGRVSIRDDRPASGRLRCTAASSSAFQVVSDAVSSSTIIRLSVVVPGETVSTMAPVVDVDTGRTITGYTYAELAGTAGVAVPNPDETWDIFIPSGGALVESDRGRQVPTTLMTMGPHEIAHPLGQDAIAVENGVRDENNLPRRSGGDHNDGVRPRTVLVVTQDPILTTTDVSPTTTVQPRPQIPLIRKPEN